ncbi:unnamed protein product [Lactuca virosa]|uniref:Uncharacterized protein n=1 Tax=Lactuca virosa TaxID=75947 RepID=A0AAU9PM73_9ASTR|nr:unnamed protein product [Lactuca virosa]
MNLLDEQPNEMKAAGVLKTRTKQFYKPINKKKKIIEVIVLGNPDDDEATNTKHMDLSKGQSTQYSFHVNADDTDHMINDSFVNNTPPSSPIKDATVNNAFVNNIPSVSILGNLHVTMHTSDVDSKIPTDNTTLNSSETPS